MSFDEKEATQYDRWYQSKLGSFVDEVETEAAFALFQPSPGEKILDIGCGTGNFSIKLAQKGAQVSGIDVSKPMLDQAVQKAERMHLAIDFKKGDARSLDFEDDRFDAVFSMAAIEFIEDLERAFAEMKRVVKPGGKILIGTIRKDSEWGRLYETMAEKGDPVFRDATFRDPEALEALDHEGLIAMKECLFIPPDHPEEKIHWDEENRLAQKKKGGFICALWEINQ